MNKIHLQLLLFGFLATAAGCSKTNPVVTALLSVTGSSLASGTAVINGAPSAINNLTSVSGITISGPGVFDYKYKLGLSGSTDCSIASGYSSQTPTGTPISQALSTDGVYILCVIGFDGIAWQSESSATTATWTKDTLGPAATVVQAAAQVDPINTTPVQFDVTFSEAISAASFTASDIVNSGTSTGVTWTVTDTGDQIHFTVTASSISGSDGTLIPSVPASTVQDIAGNNNSASTNGGDNTVTYDTAPPSSTTTMFLVTPTSSPGNSLTPDVLVSGTSSGDLIKIFADPTCSVVRGSATAAGSTTVVSVSTAFSGATTYNFYARAVDPAGNASSCSNGSLSYTTDIASPSVTINQQGAQPDPTLSNTIAFDVVFSEDINASSFTNSDLSNLGTATVSGWSISPIDGSHYTLTATVSGAGGTVTPSLAAATVLDLAGNSNTASSATDNTVTYAPLTVQPVYGTNIGDANTNWNDYIQFDNSPSGTNTYDQDATACGGSETGLYGHLNGCIHSGEKRKVIVTGYSSCANLSAEDSLHAFDWDCISDASTGNVATFFSKGLAGGKGLRDLINAGGWLANSVEVKLSGSTLATSASGAWWNNPVTALPASSGAMVSLASTGTIYYASANQNIYGYTLDADKIALVTASGAKLTYNGSGTSSCNPTSGGTSAPTVSSLLCGGTSGRKFLWIESDLNGFTGTYYVKNGIMAYNWKFSRIHASSVQKMNASTDAVGAANVFLSGGSSNLLTDLNVHSGSDGVRMKSANKNIFRKLTVGSAASSSGCDGGGGCALLALDSASDSNRFYDLALANANNTGSAFGIAIFEGSSNVFSRVNISNISAAGINSEAVYLGGYGPTDGNIFTQLTASGASDAGAYIDSLSANNIISHATFANNTYNSIYMTGSTVQNNLFNSVAALNSSKPVEFALTSASGNKFHNIAAVPLSSATAAVNTTSTGSTFADFSGYLLLPTSPSCIGNETNLGASCAGSGMNAYTSSSWTNAFVSVASDVVVGATTLSFSSLTTLASWTAFESIFRSWGKNYSITNSLSRGACTAGTCAIWDFSANSLGPLYNNSYNGATANGTLNTDSAPCAASTVSATDLKTVGALSFLVNAIELDSDQVGNDNGLCEANENCLWAPNIGSYQGKGALSSGYCSVDDGAGPGLDGIRIFTHSAN